MKQNVMKSTRTRRKSKAAEVGDGKKPGLPADNVHESKVKK